MHKPTNERAFGYTSDDPFVDDIPPQEPWAGVIGELYHSGQVNDFWTLVINAPQDNKFEEHFEKWVSNLNNLPPEIRKRLIDHVKSYGQ